MNLPYCCKKIPASDANNLGHHAATKKIIPAMNHATKLYLNIVMPSLILLMAGCFIFIALKTLIGRRPIVFSSRWLFGFMCLAFLPSILNSIFLGFASLHGSMVTWINPVMFSVLLIFFWIQMKGYLAFAISDTYFREALLATTSSLGYTVEETMSCLKIKETGQEINVSIQGWIGSAQLKAAGRGSGELVTKLASGMNDYFKTTPGKMNYMISYFYLIIGGFMIVISSMLFFLMKKS